MEHFEGHGDQWNALGFEDGEILEIIPESIKKGTLAQEYVSELSDNSEINYILYPESNAVQICSLILSENNKNTAEAFYPVLEGLKNQIIIEELFTWENNLEGEVEASCCDKINLSFFAPFYKHNFSNMEKDAKVDVYLSGLAFSVEKAVMELEIEEGPLYEMALSNYLKDNPQKTKNDFPFVTVSMAGSVIFLPTDTCAVYEYRGIIHDLEHVTFLGKNIIKAKVPLIKNDDGYDVFINLYFFEGNVKDFDCKIGDDIQCVIWLTGYIN